MISKHERRLSRKPVILRLTRDLPKMNIDFQWIADQARNDKCFQKRF
jgi:hypothetical protein